MLTVEFQITAGESLLWGSWVCRAWLFPWIARELTHV